MKNKLWLFQIPVIMIFAAAFWVHEMGVQGELTNEYLRDEVFHKLRRVVGSFSDMKFRMRGPIQPKNKIVVLDIDNQSLEVFGRWPWHRDVTAALVERAFELGAKVVGLDIVFSEKDIRVPDELVKELIDKKIDIKPEKFETDLALLATIDKHKDRLVMGWTTDVYCQPLYNAECAEKIKDPELQQPQFRPPGYQKFAFNHFNTPQEFLWDKTPFVSIMTLIPNIDIYNAVSSHAGYFNIEPDRDSMIRRTTLFKMIDGKPYPSLGLAMARVGLADELTLELDKNLRVQRLGFARSGKIIPVTPLGSMEINFRGPRETFTYISATEVLTQGDKIEGTVNRTLAGMAKADVLKDAYVLVGPSAIGVFDMRAFPFDENVPGVEGHATILDNILAGDALIPSYYHHGSFILLLVMIVGALLFAYITQKMEAVPALLLFIVTFSGFGFTDLKVLFENGYNLNTGFLYIEFFTVFVLILAAKYVLEERSKKFLRGAMSRYVAPAVVDEILKDPESLTLGGVKKDLTILFSDIRGFTTFSEKMDAKVLATFLNEYLELQTNTIFKHRGTVDKYIGDAIMAFWGAPLAQPTHGKLACEAAIGMVKALNEHRDRLKAISGSGEVEIEIGIGLNSGMVTVGNMGSKDKMNYTVIGDHVNLASRLEGLTKYYGVEIITSRMTIDQIKESGESLPPHRILDNVKVKGKKTAVELVQLVTDDAVLEATKQFQDARAAYQARKWNEAIDGFRATSKYIESKTGTADGPSEMYIERCEELKKSPPAPDWDGSWEMTSK